MTDDSEHYSRLRDDADATARNLRSALFHWRLLHQEADDYEQGMIADMALGLIDNLLTHHVRKMEELAGRFEAQRQTAERQEADDALPQPQRCPHALPDDMRDQFSSENDAPPEERQAWRKIVRAAADRRMAELREP